MKLSRHAVFSFALALATLGPTPAAALAPPGPDDVAVEVPDAMRTLRLELPAAVLDALRTRDWQAALAGLRAMDARKLTGPLRADHAFLVAWASVRAGKAADALPLLALVEAGDGSAPPAHQALVRAEVLRAGGRALDALAALEQVPDDSELWPRSVAQRAEILHELGRTADAAVLYDMLVRRPDPADGSAFALLALARRRGPGTPGADALLRRLWTWYPGTPEEAEGSGLLAQTADAAAPPWTDVATRAQRMMDRGDLDGAITLAGTVASHAGDGSAAGCALAYTLGRSLYKRNRLSDAVAAFGQAGTRCAGVAGGEGEKTLYLQGMAEFRRSNFDASARAYAAIAKLYPDTSFADDGLTRAGISAVEAGDVEAALSWWRQALDRYPEGDTVPEATFRLAFTLYDEGRPAEAITMADRLAALPLANDEVHVRAGQYWAARWRVFPQVAAPNDAVKDAVARQEAATRWADLAQGAPYHYYGALASARLAALDPARAQAVGQRADRADGFGPWQVRAAFLADPAVASGVALLRLGLLGEAAAALRDIDTSALLPDEMGWLMELRVATGDWVAAHDELHRWLRVRPLGTLGVHEPQIVRLAFPDRYWSQTQAAEAESGLPVRLLHALVREESSFDRTIVSFAGARGLAQLMPATADGVARRLGLTVSRAQLFDPDTNLRLGARYLADMVAREKGNTSLALAAYNAGPGNVDKWVAERGNLPLDEFVERIPFRETRGYVKRVTSTWQAMRYAFHPEQPAFVDLTPYLAAVIPPANR